jgi:hypothetical protein
MIKRRKHMQGTLPILEVMASPTIRRPQQPQEEAQNLVVVREIPPPQ